MTTHDPKKRTNRQRDSRKQERRQERHTDNAALRDQVRALGGGDLDHWDTDSERGQGDE